MIVDCGGYAEGRRRPGPLSLEDAADWLADPDHFLWLGLRLPDESELDQVEAVLGIDKDALDEARSPHVRPVLSTRPELTWLVVRTARYDRYGKGVVLGELSVLMTDRAVVTIRHGRASPLQGLRHDLESRGATTSPAAVLAAIDANATQVALQQNEDMRRISAWVAMAAVPTLVAGIYGMNFETLPELRWRFGYPMVLLGMAVVAGLMYRAFRRSGWL